MRRTAKPMMALLVLVLLMGAGHGAWTTLASVTGDSRALRALCIEHGVRSER